MRTLKLQVQTSVDGYMAREAGEMDFLQWKMDDKLHQFVTDLTPPVAIPSSWDTTSQKGLSRTGNLPQENRRALTALVIK